MSVVRDDWLMTIEGFVAFAETRPDDERWELVDGEPLLNPSPAYAHQKIVGNIIRVIGSHADQAGTWEVLPALGVRLSAVSMPVPDALARPATPIVGPWCDDMIAAFEVVSPSSRTRDLRWKREAYAALPSLRHYVVLQQDRVEVRLYDRADGWTERVITDPVTVVRLDALGIAFAAARLYAGTGLV